MMTGEREKTSREREEGRRKDEILFLEAFLKNFLAASSCYTQLRNQNSDRDIQALHLGQWSTNVRINCFFHGGR